MWEREMWGRYCMEYESSSRDAAKDSETNSICERLVKFYKICIITS